MEIDVKILEKYARLIVKTGINVKKDQVLVIRSPIECASFTRQIARIAFEEGAGDVVISWSDELFSKIRYMHAPEKVFEEFPEWNREFYLSYARKGAAFVSVLATDPELMKGVDPVRIAKDSKTRSAALKEYSERIMSGKNSWCVVSIPTKS